MRSGVARAECGVGWAEAGSDLNRRFREVSRGLPESPRPCPLRTSPAVGAAAANRADLQEIG